MAHTEPYTTCMEGVAAQEIARSCSPLRVCVASLAGSRVSGGFIWSLQSYEYNLQAEAFKQIIILQLLTELHTGRIIPLVIVIHKNTL